MGSIFRSSFVTPACAALACLALAACGSGQDAQEKRESLAREADPPGAALALSIGGAVADEGTDGFAAAINCASALGLTRERLAQMSSGPVSREINLIARAEDFFENEASEAASTGETAGASVRAAIARRKREKADDPTGQAQLAIACLRRFGEEVT